MLLQCLGDPGKTTFVAGAVPAPEMAATAFPVVWKYEANLVLDDTTNSKIGQKNEVFRVSLQSKISITAPEQNQTGSIGFVNPTKS